MLSTQTRSSSRPAQRESSAARCAIGNSTCLNYIWASLLFCLHLAAYSFDFREHPEQVATENFAAILWRISACKQRRRNLRQISRRVDALRKLTTHAVEVGPQPHMIHTGHLGDVVEVVDQVAQRRTGNAVRILALDLLEVLVSDLFALRLVMRL